MNLAKSSNVLSCLAYIRAGIIEARSLEQKLCLGEEEGRGRESESYSFVLSYPDMLVESTPAGPTSIWNDCIKIGSRDLPRPSSPCTIYGTHLPHWLGGWC